MLKFVSRSLLAVCLASLSSFALADMAHSTLAKRLAQSAPELNSNVLSLALTAMDCAVRNGEPSSNRLAVIDYSLPSSKERLWVFDLKKQKLMHKELVAHGKNSGEKMASQFSNRLGSLQTSIGLFRTRDTYYGSNGYSLRLEGLEAGVNDRAMERAIVMHGAPYVSQAFSRQHGRIGRSWGCPAVRAGVARTLIDNLKGGQFLFSYYPDQRWLHTSLYLNCREQLASVSTSLTGSPVRKR